MSYFLQKLSTTLFFILLSCISKGQINFYGSFTPLCDSNEMDLSKLVKQRKLDSAINLINMAIKASPNKGVNYFNRAVINYYKKILSKNFYLKVDTLIYNDCKRAMDYGYKKPEVYYLIFSQISQTDRVLGSGLPSYVDEDGLSKELNYKDIKEYIDSAIEISDHQIVKYFFARMIFFYKRLGEEQSIEQRQRSYGNDYQIQFPDDNRFKLDCRIVIEKSKDNYKKGAGYYFLSQISVLINKDTIGAIQNLSDAIAADSGNIAYYSERATLKYNIGNYRGAILDFNKYLAKENRPEDLISRGNCFSLIENEKQAVLDYTSAINLFEKQLKERKEKGEFNRVDYIKIHLGQGYYFRGISYLQLKNKSKACLDFNQSLNFGYKMAQETITENCQ
ncbi:hypothetical protein BH11BAC5_BH11BAC5_14210 [soil metagenome]